MLIFISLHRWKDTLLIPSFMAVASGILLIAHFISCSFDSLQQDATEEVLLAVNEETRLNWFGCKIIQHVHSNGGPVIFGFKIARLTGCLTLFSLSGICPSLLQFLLFRMCGVDL